MPHPCNSPERTKALRAFLAVQDSDDILRVISCERIARREGGWERYLAKRFGVVRGTAYKHMRLAGWRADRYGNVKWTLR